MNRIAIVLGHFIAIHIVINGKEKGGKNSETQNEKM